MNPQLSFKSKYRTYQKEQFFSFLNRHALIVTVSTTFVMSVLLYRHHIRSGISLFMTATDGFGQAWPYMAVLSNYIRAEGFPQWYFGAGLGGHLAGGFNFIVTPFRLFPLLLGYDAIPGVMVWVQISQIVFACLFFFLYLKTLRHSPAVCAIVSIMYAFSGQMILRGGNWVHYGQEVVFVALLLYATERFLTYGKWKLFPLALFLLISVNSVAFTYLYTILLLAYVTIRYLAITSFKWGGYLRLLAKCALIYIPAVLMISFLWVSVFFAMLHSNRGMETLDRFTLTYVLGSLFRLNEPLWHVAFFRTLNPEILGVGWDFHRNNPMGAAHLDLPLFYVGMLSVVTLPLFFVCATKKLRIIAGFGCLAVILYLTSPMTANVLHMFISPMHFKLGGFWVSVILLVMCSYTLEQMIVKPVSPQIVAGIGIGLLSVVSIFYLRLANAGFVFGVVYPIALGTLILSMVYICSLQLLSHLNIRKGGLVLLGVVVVGEAGLVARTTVNTHFENVALPAYVSSVTQGIAIFDRIGLIEEMMDDELDFFRLQLEQPHRRPFNYNRSMNFGFYDSQFYTHFLHSSQFDFLQAFSIPTAANHVYGLRDNPILRTLVGYRYYLTDNLEAILPFGYTYYRSGDGLHAFRNAHALPLGFAYTYYVTRQQLDELHNESRELLLLQAAVLADNHISLPNFNRVNTTPVMSGNVSVMYVVGSHMVANLSYELPDYIQGQSTGNDPFVVLRLGDECNEFSAYQISMTINSSVPTTARIFYDIGAGFNERDSFRQSISAGSTEITLYLDDVRLDSLRIDPTEVEGAFSIENISIQQIDNSFFYAVYIEAVHARRSESLNLTHFSHNHITGTIETFGDRILFFSIPNAPGWRLYINGERTPIETVNIGFIGAFVGEGLHEIELRYRLPGLLPGTIMSGVGVTWYATMLVLDKKGKMAWLKNPIETPEE